MANYRSTEPVLMDTTEEQSIDEIIKATDGVLTEEQQAIIEEFDREQKVRKFSSKVVEKIYYYFALFVALYHLYTCAFGGPATLIHRSIHVATMLAMAVVWSPWWLLPPAVYLLAIFVSALWSTRSAVIAVKAVPASVIQLGGYGCGFLKAYLLKIVLGRGRNQDEEIAMRKGK